MGETQRRLSDRISAEVLLWWTHDWDPIPINLLDISEGGMLCEFPESVEEGQHVELQFEFPRHGELIDSRCEVVHVRKQGNHSFLVGLRISELAGIDQKAFSEKLNNLPRPGDD